MNLGQSMKWSGFPQLVVHQAAWWACVLLQGWTGPLLMLVFLGLHLWMTRTSFRYELVLILVSATVGVGLDNALSMLDEVTYEGSVLVVHSPLWLVSIWAGFGATVRHSQSILFRTRIHAFLTGLLGGPLAYWGGERLGVLDVFSALSWGTIGVLWTAAMLTLYSTDRYLPPYK